MRAWVAPLVGWLLLAPPAAAEWRLEVRVVPQAVALGETVDVCITVTATLATMPTASPTIQPPSWGAGFVSTGLSNQSESYDGSNYRFDSSWTLTCDRLGELEVPSIAVTFPSTETHRPLTLRTEPVSLQVTAEGPRVDEDTGARLRRPRAAAAESSLRGWVLGGLAGAILVSAVAAGILLRRGDGQGAATGPEAVCRGSLTAAAARLRAGDEVGFYAESAAAVRTYVGRIAGVDGEGLTSREVGDILSEHGAPRPLREAAVALMTAADEVRYARGSLPSERSWQLLRRLTAALGGDSKEV